MNPPDQVVVFVHGTWGRGILPFRLTPVAAWCKEGSQIRETIQATLDCPVHFEAFPWSGRNSTGARLAAANHFLEYLSSVRHKWPELPIHIVAHSHGGNVAMYCLRDESARAEVKSLTCMSTPFLIVRPRIMSKVMADKIRFLLLALICMLFFAALFGGLYARSEAPVEASKESMSPAAEQIIKQEKIREMQELIDKERARILQASAGEVLSASQKERLDLIKKVLDRTQRDLDEIKKQEAQSSSPWSILPNILIISLIGSAIGYVLRKMGKMLDWVHRWSHRVGRKLSLPKSLPFPVLILRNTSDEASNALGGVQFMSSITSLALRWSAAVLPDAGDELGSAHWIGKLFRFCMAIAALGAIVVAVESLVSFPLGPIGPAGLWIIVGAIVGFVTLVLLSFLSIPLIWFLIVLLAVAMAPFGFSMVLGALSLQVSAEGCPPGVWTIFQLASIPRQTYRNQGLQHSTYDNLAALKKLADWIKASSMSVSAIRRES